MLFPTLTPAAADLSDAIVVGDDRLSREDLVGAATAVAERIGGAHTLAVLARPTPDTILAIVGCLIAGVAAVPVPPDSGARELDHILTDSGAQAWLGAAPDDPTLPVIPVRRYARSWHRHPEPPESSTALILYTSGTTGLPKGVPISRRAIAAGLDALADAWRWTSDDALAHGLPLFHVHGLILGVLGPLRRGGRLIHTAKPAPEKYAAAIDDGATMFFGVPTVWTRVANDESAAQHLSSARLLVSGSAPLPVPVFESIRSLTGHEIVERYGMTETMITVSTRADGERRPGWVGLPLAGVDTRIREGDNDLPHDGETVGDLHVRGPMMSSGYLNQPEKSAESWLDDGFFATGDVAVIDPDGMHRIVGRRATDLIKSGGYRIGAGEIETVLLGHPAVDEVAVIGVPDDDLGQRIVAYVVGSRVPDSELIDHVTTELSNHKRPREIRFVDGLPRNAMGKVQKKLLD
ncbi:MULTISPECIES: acyl-CoA synthetase [Gordonia]|uniref:Acyl-CoA synthetase n=2 Tax=Gordonia TaxID=2053 RepID=A0A9X3DA81_9ACTN|nr:MULTISPECIES: acyl-CoA synthetase [Gordonia]MCF3937068.1 acyl-CoA synthetase [Gordonia tangerina]MCX2966571.1 acyl-CoA synthetase [Gordonia aquimaris]